MGTQSTPDLSTDVSPLSLSTVAVVGLGTMGTGIAEVLTRAGREVIGIDTDEAAARHAVAALEASTTRAVRRERITERERQDVLARFRTFSDLQAAADADLVIEVVPEDYELKRQVITALDGIVRPETILATGTNALSVTRLAADSQRPERVLGVHFFNPAPAMKLVEVVSSVLTAPTVVTAVTALARDLGKDPIAVGDRPGFVADGLLFGYLNQAAAMYEAKYATREDIDAAMRLGCGLPMGPLALLDLIGVDTARTVLEAMYADSRDRLHAPAPILGQLAEAGLTGRKAGRGFYTYEEPGSATTVPDAESPRPPTRSAPAAPSAASASPVPGRWPAVSPRSSPRRASRSCWPPAARRRRRRRRPGSRSRWAAPWTRAGSAPRHGMPRSPRSPRPVRWTPSRTSIWPSRRWPRTWRSSSSCSRTLDKVCKPGAVLATTTSSLPVVACARATSRPEDVIGMHFFNPAPAMKLVEVVRTVLTADDVHATVRAVCTKVRKHPVDCGDRAGFIVNALLFPYLNNAIKMVQEHYATLDDIDAAMKLGGGYPMGPFELLDVVGLDVSLAIEKVLHAEFRDPGLAPAPLLEHLVAAGCLGRKTGRGFREYARR